MNKRNSKLELLRIISIFFIVLSHYVVHSGLNIDNLPLGFNKIILDICILGNVGTMLFVLISGYFLINSNKVKIKKIIHFWLQVFFYSFFIYLLLLLFNKENFNIKSLFLNMFPITFKRYWFATTYFIMYSKTLRMIMTWPKTWNTAIFLTTPAHWNPKPESALTLRL